MDYFVQKKTKKVMLKKRLGLTTMLKLLPALGGLNTSRIIIHYIYNVEVSGESMSSYVKGAGSILATLDKLIVKENYLSKQIFIMDETSLL